jgi:hypothetical protein
MSGQIICLKAMEAVLERVNTQIDDALILADMGDFDAARDVVDAIRATTIPDDAPALFLRKRIGIACDGLLNQFGKTAGVLSAFDGKEPA